MQGNSVNTIFLMHYQCRPVSRWVTRADEQEAEEVPHPPQQNEPQYCCAYMSEYSLMAFVKYPAVEVDEACFDGCQGGDLHQLN